MSLQRTQSEVEDVEMDFEAVDTSVMDEPLLAAIHGNDVATVAAAGVAETAKPTTAKTYALHEACEHGSMDVVRYLVEVAGADVNCRDPQDWTPLHYAATFQRDDDGDDGAECALVNYLLSHGADVRAEDEDGDTPLAAAIDERDDDAGVPVSRLLESVEAFDSYEAWALHHARDAEFGAYVLRTRPKLVRDAERHEFAALFAAAEARPIAAHAPEAFLLGSHGGNADVFAHVLPFLA